MKDPIKKPLLRSAGQSLHEQIDGHMYDEFVPLFTLVASGCFIAIYSWAIFLFDVGNNPLLTTFAAVSGLVILWVYVKKKSQKIKNLALGLKGERAVAQYLMHNLVNETCRVYNDLVFDEGFNIDHIIISVRGIFVLETKTRRKPDGQAQIVVERDGIHYPDSWVGSDAIDQAQRNAQYVQRWLHDQFEIEVEVKSAVLFPGWFVDDRRKGKRTWVLNPISFAQWYRNENESVSVDTYNRVKSVVMDYIINRENALLLES